MRGPSYSPVHALHLGFNSQSIHTRIALLSTTSLSHERLIRSYATSGRPRTPSFNYRKRDTPPYILRSSLNSSLITIAATFGVGISCALLLKQQNPPADEDVTTRRKETLISSIPADDALSLQLFGMADEIPPGRPGNLTVEQETKLRELWQLCAQISGVYKPETNGDATPTPSESSDKKKRSRLSIFRRKRDDDASESTSGTTTPTPTDIANSLRDDDKHGLNKAFKLALDSMSPDEFRDAFWNMVKHDHPDGLLLRFLRARKWDVNAALVMAISALHWRQEDSKVDSDIMFRGEEGMLNLSKSSDYSEQKEGSDFMAQIRMGKSFLHGSDKQGRPLCFVRARLHRQGEQSESSLERYTIYTIETARMFLKPPVDTATIVFDMTDFSIANMDYTPVKFMIKCFEANYPESLGAVLVHRAPWIFQGIWKIIKGWLDPVVAGKVHFTNDLGELEEFIERDSIIKELGGPKQWEYQYDEPHPDENKAMKDAEARKRLEDEREELAKKYEDVVRQWIGDAVWAEGGGGKASEELRKRRDEIALQLRDNYWQLDPYVRARSVYDRTGVLPALGKPASGKENEKPQDLDSGEID